MSAENELREIVKKEKVYLVKKETRYSSFPRYGLAINKPSRNGSRAVLFKHTVAMDARPNEAGYDIHFAFTPELSLELDHHPYLHPASAGELVDNLEGDITPFYEAVALLKNDGKWNNLVQGRVDKVRQILDQNNATLVKRSIGRTPYYDWENVQFDFLVYVVSNFRENASKEKVLATGVFPTSIRSSHMVPRIELEPIRLENLDPMIWTLNHEAFRSLEKDTRVKVPTELWRGELG